MKTAIAVLCVLALASCASEPQHGRGGYHRGGERGDGGERGPGGGQFGQFGQQAQRPPHPGAEPEAVLLAGFDENFDLIIMPNEINDGIAREFARADANHDRIITRDEFAAWSVRAFGGAYPPHWLAFDADSDGRITPAEFAAEIHSLVARHDADGDGILDHKELVAPDIARSETADSAVTDDDPRPPAMRPPQR